MAVSEPTLLQTLEAAEFAFNHIRNTKLTGCPHGFKDTYQIVRALELHAYFRRERKEDGDV